TPCTETMFSQGQFQLLAIARAVVLNPRILLLDEITANLDSGTEAMVLSALRAASRDRTVISVSHRLYGGEEKEGVRFLEL
ncbi:MAG: ATP-binding cassette domain-containing protein, partial [Anaerovoracaceae bacterium]